MKVDAAIIGGGLSGLAAAVELAARGASVTLVEQSPKLGGRCYSYVDPITGDVVDNGQHVLLGAYHNVLRYLDVIGTRQFLKSERRLRLTLCHPTKGNGTFEMSTLPKPFHLASGLMKFRILSIADRYRMLNVWRVLTDWSSSSEAKLASVTIDRWLENLGQSHEARRSFWEPIAVSVMNEQPQLASALLFARVLRTVFFGPKEESAILIPTVGQTELYVLAAQRFLAEHGAQILTDAEVTSLSIASNRCEGAVLKDGREIRSSVVISAVPYFAVARFLPQECREIEPFVWFDRFASSPIVSIHLWFDRRFMEEEMAGLIGKRLQWVFDRQRILDDSKSTGYISAVISGARDLVDLEKEQLVEVAVADLQDAFPQSHRAVLTHSVVIKEKRATFSPTCEVEPLRPSAETPLSDFLLAGDWTNTGLPATIESAVMSGFAAAQHVK